MGFEIINKLKKEKGLTNAQIAKLSGVTLSTLDKITSGVNTNPKLDTLQSICRVLGCRLDDFDDRPKIDKVEKYSAEESNIIKKYRSLDHDGQEAVKNTLYHEIKRVEIIQQQTKRIAELEANAEQAPKLEMYRYPYLHRIACAGTGFLFDDIPIDTIEVPYVDGADFIVGVNGDSMEPDYHDGELLYVRKTDWLNIGDVGIFTVRNECYVKEFGEYGLISHNKNYDDIPGDEDVRIIGKVIEKVSEKYY